MTILSGIHIVIVPAWWPTPEQPHAGVFFADYVEAFQSAGAQVGVIYPDLVGLRHATHTPRAPLRPRVEHESTATGAPVVRIRGLQTSFGSIDRRVCRFRDWLAKGLAAYRERHGRPDILHAMCALPSAWACTQLDDPLAKRIVLTEHTGPFSLIMNSANSAKLVRTAFDQSRARIAVSDHLRRQIETAGIPGEIEVIGNPVSTLFTTNPVDKKKTNERTSGLYVGRLTREKGIPTLLTTIDSLRRQRKRCEFHFVGDGPIAIPAAIAGSNDEFIVTHHPACPRANVATFMQTADFLVHPSLEETFGMTVAEALCMGLPVVTTRGTACAEYIDDHNGILVEPADESSLVSGLLQMIASCRDYDRPAIAGRARERFSNAAVANAYQTIFERVLESN